MLRRIEHAISCVLDPLLAVVRVAIIGLAAGIVLVTFIQVVLRYVFNSAFFGAEELARFLFTWLIFLGGTIALDRGLHFAVDVLVNLLPSALQRIIFVLVQAIVLGVLVILVVNGIKITVLNFRQLSPALQIPISFPYAAIPTASALMILVVLRRLCRGVSRPAPFLPE